MKQLKLNVQSRNESGRGPARRLRASGSIPAVLYGKHTEPASLAVEKKEIDRLLKEAAGTTALVQLSRDGGKPVLSLLQEMQRNPVTDQILHIDFQEVSTREEMLTHVNIQLVGEAYGVKNQNGTLDFVSYTVDIRCLPQNLPGLVELDVSNLKVGESLHVKDLPIYEGVTYTADPDHVIVSCIEQRVDTAVEAATEDAAPAEAEPEKKAE